MTTRVNSDSKFKSCSAEQATHARSPEHSLLQQTSFELHRTSYLQNSKKIRSLRLMQHLGRYIPLEEKQQKVRQFKGYQAEMVAALNGMQNQAVVYKNLNQRMKKKSEFEFVFEFREMVKKEIKEVEGVWVELFEEGSLKRLGAVLRMLEIQEDGLKFDIGEWAKTTEGSFRGEGMRNGNCCCCVF